MTSNANFAEIAALAGDPARAGMLHALMDGRALTASELARVAGVAPQTASGHLTRMTTAGLLKVEKRGRHRCHRHWHRFSCSDGCRSRRVIGSSHKEIAACPLSAMPRLERKAMAPGRSRWGSHMRSQLCQRLDTANGRHTRRDDNAQRAAGVSRTLRSKYRVGTRLYMCSEVNNAGSPHPGPFFQRRTLRPRPL